MNPGLGHSELILSTPSDGQEVACVPFCMCFRLLVLMTQAYRSSMLKAFRKALEEQRFTFLIGLEPFSCMLHLTVHHSSDCVVSTEMSSSFPILPLLLLGLRSQGPASGCVAFGCHDLDCVALGMDCTQLAHAPLMAS